MAACLLQTALAAPVAAQPAPAPIRLPALGETASGDLSVAAERRVGDQVMREGRRDPAYLDDPVLLEYVDGLWQQLLRAARDKGDVEPEIDRAFAWEAFLVKDRSVNAFAMPGGYIGVHLGLIALTTTSDQLASVLAHELTHVTQRHIARSIAPQQQASLLALAGLLLAIAVAGRSQNVDGANAAIMGGQAAALQTQLNFSREMEREADRIGYAVLGAAGFSTAGMAAMFEKLDQASRLNDNNGFPYLRSHPLTVDRIAEARNRTLLTGTAAPPPTLLHALMQQRARVLMDDSARGLQRLSGASSSPLAVDRVAALYGGALAASLLREPARAQALAQQALEQAQALQPRQPEGERALQLLQAQVWLAQGDGARAATTLQAMPPDARSGRAPLLLTAQAWLEQFRAAAGAAAGAAGAPAPAPGSALETGLRQSTEALQTWVAVRPQDAQAWELLSATTQALGLKLRSLRAGAEARAALGDLNGAIDRLRAAQQGSRSSTGQDFIEASVIDTRLRQLTALRRQLVLEAREARGGRTGEDVPPPP